MTNTMQRRLRHIAAAAVAVVATGAVATPAAAQVWNTPVGQADWTGTRTISGGGLVDGDPGYNTFTLTWSIALDGNLLRYTYSFSNLDPRNGVSHAIFELSPNCTSTSGCVTGVTGGAPTFGTFGPANSNPGFPTGKQIFGVKIDTQNNSTTYSFLSNRLPVWGDFYAKGSNDLYTYNTGLGDRTSNNTNWYIARPDTELAVVPEPSTYALMGMGLAGLAGVARRRRQTA